MKGRELGGKGMGDGREEKAGNATKEKDGRKMLGKILQKKSTMCVRY